MRISNLNLRPRLDPRPRLERVPLATGTHRPELLVKEVGGAKRKAPQVQVEEYDLAF